jgi:signal transduction histidine kinase
MRILVVDDVPENVYMLEALLGGNGFEVATASNGLAALEELRRNGAALVVSDILMPKMDGFQLCRAMKAAEATRDVPVIFYTATYTTEKDREFALSLGASRFIVKPADPAELIEVVRGVLDEARRGSSQEGTARVLGETEYLRGHQALLVKKLEDKVAELERSEAELERRVRDRTRELEGALQLADAASRAKSVFLASMSHELRTPLNGIIGFAEELAEGHAGELNERQREYAANIGRSGKHLLGLINDILDLAKIESGKMELEASAFALRPALEFSVVMVRERARKRGVSVSLAVAQEVDCAVVADERKLKQILFNLLSNAVKFTPAGGTVGVTARSGRDGLLELSVADTGIGIDAADMPRLFQEFTQLRPAGAGAEEGTGLGLALTRKLVELHGGSIRAESVVGEGSTFTVELPVVPPRVGARPGQIPA